MLATAERIATTPKKEFLVSRPIVDLVPVTHTKATLIKWIQWVNDPDIRTWMLPTLPESAEDINEWLTKVSQDPRRHYFSIMTDGNMVGFVSVRQDHAPATTGEIGIVIGEKEFQSRGIGKETIRQLLEYAKNEVKLTSVRALIKPTNEKSIRLFTGQGFTHTKNISIDGTSMMKFEKSL